MLYPALRALASFALRRFYRVQVSARPLPREGPLLFVGNHPNALMDPTLVCVSLSRELTFLAKEPLFRLPLLGWILRRLGALPVYRRQDDPQQMGKNEGTLEAAARALGEGKAILIFPEGRSHSEPALGELKTGAARIAFRAVRAGAPVQIVPVGLTYEEKSRFRSTVRVEVGAPLVVSPPQTPSPEGEVGEVRLLTAQIADRLRGLTLNLEQWEDLPLLETAEAFYALRRGEPQKDAERQRRFARAMELLKEEQPSRYAALRAEAVALRRRLALVRAEPGDLALLYQPWEVLRFAVRNLLWLLLGVPLFALGMVLFAVPFFFARVVDRWINEEEDMRATVKFLATLLVSPAWWLLLTALAWQKGAGLAVLAFVGALPLALFTRYFLERRQEALHDLRVFFILGHRGSLKARLLSEGERFAARLEEVGAELGSRLTAPGSPPVPEP